MTGTPHFEIRPNPALTDEFVTVRVLGLSPGEVARLRARLTDDAGQLWESHATFRADERGVVSAATQPPLDGSYSGVDPMGLFWSMTCLSHARPQPFALPLQHTLVMHFTAYVGGRVAAEAALERHCCAPDVTCQPVRESGLVGTLCLPPLFDDDENRLTYPGVLVLGGADGRPPEHAAALLASHGYAALALTYFRHEGLPPQFFNIPLEYFETALAWLVSHPAVAGDRPGVIGVEKGGELALLLGAAYPQVGAVVAYVPSSVVFQGLTPDPFILLSGKCSSWSQQGEPLPYVSYRLSAGYAAGTLRRALGGGPLSLRETYAAGMRDPLAMTQAAIPVEQIAGPVLLISGGDDRFWPSGELAALAAGRLAEHDHPYPYHHLHYPDAGHGLWFSHTYLPATVNNAPHPVLPGRIALGGTPPANAHARAEAWAQVQQFLAASLGG